MIAAKKRPAPKKEKLKDIIDAVAAKENLLRPLPTPVVDVKEEQPVKVIPKVDPVRASSVTRSSPFFSGLQWGAGVLLGAVAVVGVLGFIASKLLVFPAVAQYLRALIALISVVSSVRL